MNADDFMKFSKELARQLCTSLKGSAFIRGGKIKIQLWIMFERFLQKISIYQRTQIDRMDFEKGVKIIFRPLLYGTKNVYRSALLVHSIDSIFKE